MACGGVAAGGGGDSEHAGRGKDAKVETAGLLCEVSSLSFWKLCEDAEGAITSVHSTVGANLSEHAGGLSSGVCGDGGVQAARAQRAIGGEGRERMRARMRARMRERRGEEGGRRAA